MIKMSCCTINYDLFFDKNKSIWFMKEKDEKNKDKKLGDSNITYYYFNRKYYVVITIDRIYVKKLNEFFEDPEVANFYKTVKVFNILDKKEDIIGNSFFLRKTHLLPEEEKYHCNMIYIKNNFYVNGYLVPEEIWSMIQYYLPKIQKNVCVYYDDNLEYCNKPFFFNFYMYGINVRGIQDFFVLPYWHSKREARRAIAKYFNLDNSNVGIFLYKKGNLYRDPDRNSGYLIIFYNHLNLIKFKNNKIHFLDTKGNNIYENNIIKHENKKYRINKIMYN